MSFRRDRECIKYFIAALIILICIYSNKIADLFIPIFDNVYYGNLTDMFVAIASAIIWGLEILVIGLVARRFKVYLYKDPNADKSEMELWRVVVLFVITILPMIIVSACINWKVKIVYALGVRVTTVGLVCNAAAILSYAVRMILMVMFIRCVQEGLDKLFEYKNPNLAIPFGAIFALLTFGIIDFFVLGMDLRAFYLVASFVYGLIYLISRRKFGVTYILCYLIYLL